MRADTMRQRLTEFKQCEGLDAWLADEAFEAFKETSGKTIAIPIYKLESRGWERRDFNHAMRELGYYVEFKSVNRFDPEMCYISLPDPAPFEPTLPPGL